MIRSKWTGRKAILSLALIILIAFTAGFAQAQQKSVPKAEKWKLQVFFDLGSRPVYRDSLKQFANDVKIMSQGFLEFQLFSVGELVPFSEQLDATGRGIVDATVSFTNQWAGKNTAFEMLGGYPFSCSNFELAMWYIAGGGQKYMDKLYSQFGIKALPIIGMFLEVGGHSKFKIDTLSAMIGKRYRVGAGSPQAVLKRLGINPVSSSVAEGYTILDRGVVEILKMSTAENNYGAGYHEVAKHAFWPGWTKVGDCSGVLEMNMKKWNALPDYVKRIIETNVQALSWRYAGLEAYESAEAFRKMEEKGVKMTRLDDASLKKMKEAADQVIAEYAGKNPIFKEIWQNRVNFTKDYERMWKFAHMPSFE